jgi:hypothetical protein
VSLYVRHEPQPRSHLSRRDAEQVIFHEEMAWLNRNKNTASSSQSSKGPSRKVGLDGVDPDRLVRAGRVGRDAELVRRVERARSPDSVANDAVLVRLDVRELGLERGVARRVLSTALEESMRKCYKTDTSVLTVSERSAWRLLVDSHW